MKVQNHRDSANMSSDNFNVRVLEDSIYLGKNRLENDDDDNNDNDQ